jgi:hypothetical protein
MAQDIKASPLLQLATELSRLLVCVAKLDEQVKDMKLDVSLLQSRMDDVQYPSG